MRPPEGWRLEAERYSPASNKTSRGSISAAENSASVVAPRTTERFESVRETDCRETVVVMKQISPWLIRLGTLE
jgi:hypothetical protein